MKPIACGRKKLGIAEKVIIQVQEDVDSQEVAHECAEIVLDLRLWLP